MKSLFLILVLFQCVVIHSQVKWDGEGNDGKWKTPLNWTGDILPASGDQVILDNSFFPGSFNVTLPDSSVTIGSLVIVPDPGKIIHVILPSSNTLTANAFVARGTLYGLVINNGGIFQNSSGSSSGTVLSISDSIRINNGGLYKHNTRSAHASYVSILSRTSGTENGIFEYDVPSVNSYAVSISNRVYGKLVLSAAAAGGLKSYFSSGSNPFKIRGDFQINSGVTYGLDLNDTVFVEGNFNQFPASKFNLANGANNAVLFLKKNITIDTIAVPGSGVPQIHIAGNSIQAITATTTFPNPGRWFMNNLSGATLNSDLLLSSVLTFQSGKISIGTYNLGVIAIQNPSANSYIITNGTGLLKMPSGDSLVIFPVGPDSNSFNPVTVAGGNGLHYSIRVQRGINPMVAFPTYGINRTWDIFTAGNPSNPANISFQYNSSHANAGCDPQGPMELLKYIPDAWNIISTDLVPTGNDPFIVTASINSFNASFAVGRNGGWTLPLEIIQFDVFKSGMSLLFKWSLSAAANSETTMEIQQSDDGRNFSHLAAFKGKGETGPFYYKGFVTKSIKFFRLLLIDSHGSVSYSRVVKISSEIQNTFITSIRPIPVQDKISVVVTSPGKQKIQLIISDMTGRVVSNLQTVVNYGANQVVINTKGLGSGVYQLFGQTSSNKTNTIRFIKL